MEKVFELRGLNCPHCSAEIERETGKMQGVKSSVVNLIKQTLTLELVDDFNSDISKKVEKIVHKHEPDVQVYMYSNSKSDNHSLEESSHSHDHDCCHSHGDSHHIQESSHSHDHDCCHSHGDSHHIQESSHSHEEFSHSHDHDCCHSHGDSHHIQEFSHSHDHDCCHSHGDSHHIQESSHSHEEFSHSHDHDCCHHHENFSLSCNTKFFSLKGLNCPHCSAEIEKDMGNINGIEFSSVNLINQTLEIAISANYSGNIYKDVENIVHKHEPAVEVTEITAKTKPQKTDTSDNPNRRRIIKLVTGAVIYIAGVSALYTIKTDTALINIIPLAILIAAYILLGGDVILKAVKNILHGRVFDENFLMTISTAGAFVIGEYPEAVAVMLFYQIGEFFQSLAVQRSRKSIADLMDIRPEYANVSRNGCLVKVSPDEVNEGETIVVKAGEKIPLDSVITDGSSTLDTRALTGESLPRSVEKGDTVLSGCINESGVLTMRVVKTSSNSTVAKIIDLVENASARKAPAENFITVFSRYYTPVVVILAVLLTAVPVLFLGGSFLDYVMRSFVFLVISCPCALVISVPLTFFGGIGAASKKGVLIKGGNYLEAISKIDTMVFDKTGTLTKGDFTVTEIIPENGCTQEQLLELTAYAECLSNHPIARSIQQRYGKEPNRNTISDYREISGNGVSAKISDSIILAGNEKLMKQFNISYKPNNSIGTKIYTARNNKYIGCIIIEDELKKDSKSAVENLKKSGIKTIMLTGDNKQIGKNVAEKLGIDEYIAELLPDKKVFEFEKLCNNHSKDKKIAFVGDGINDAPVLARADVGIAMGGLGSDAAIEAADVILMTDEPSKLLDAIFISKATKTIVTENIVFAIGIKVIFLVLGAFGIANMWCAVIGDVGVMIAAVLNAMRILKK